MVKKPDVKTLRAALYGADSGDDTALATSQTPMLQVVASEPKPEPIQEEPRAGQGDAGVMPAATPAASPVALPRLTPKAHKLSGRGKAKPPRSELTHIGGYLDADTVEKVALLRIRLKRDNSELITLAIEELFRKHTAKRAFGDA